MAKKPLAQGNSNVTQSVKKAARVDTPRPAEPAGSADRPAAESKPTVSRTEKTPAPAVPTGEAVEVEAVEVEVLIETAALGSEAAARETTPAGEAAAGEAAEVGGVVSEAPPAPAIEEALPTIPIEHLPRPEQPRYEPPGYIRPPLENKYLNKEALRDRLWLRKEFKPIISYVGRLDLQKGVQLIKHGIFYALQQGAQFVLLGVSPEQRINEEFWHLKYQLNDNPDCHLEIGFNEELSHLIYAGSDMIIMPSLYEPCGLTQMIALKYGTVPIVRAVGGLMDTVFDRDYSDRPWEQRNGYVFHQADATGLESAMLRAIGLWYSYPDEFRRLVINGMKCDYSWNYPGQHYLNIYEHIRCK